MADTPQTNGVARASNWAAILGTCFSMVAITGGSLWGITIRPLQSQVDSLTLRLAQHEKEPSHAGTNNLMREMGLELQKVETQLGKASSLANQQHQALWQIVVPLAEKAGFPIPMPSHWPTYGNQE